MTGRVGFLGGPFDGLETKIGKCRHGNMPDIDLCMRVVEPNGQPVFPLHISAWPTVLGMMTTSEAADMMSEAGVDVVYDAARYGWLADAQVYVYAETVRHELHREREEPK